MRLARWSLFALLLSLVVGLLPANAAGPNVVLVDSGTYKKPKDLPNVLGEDEVARLKQIIRPINGFGLISPVSPDDVAVWGVVGENIGFMDIRSGDLTPFNLDAFGPIFPAAFAGSAPTTWLDNETLAGLGLNFAAESAETALVMVTINRVSGEVNAFRLDPEAVNLFMQPNFIPLSFAPNGTTVMAAMLPVLEEEEAMMRIQMTHPQLKLNLKPDLKLPQTYQAKFNQVKNRFPSLVEKFDARLGPDSDRSILEITKLEIPMLTIDLATGAKRDLMVIDESTIPLYAAWSPDSARLAFTTIKFPDPDPVDQRPLFDGALVNEQMFKDVTGQLPPSENPYLQGNIVNIFDIGTGLKREMRAADGDGKLLVGLGWSTDDKTLLTLALHPAKVAGRKYPIYGIQFLERYSYRFYNEDFKQVGALDLPNKMSGAWFTSPVNAWFVSPDEVLLTLVSYDDMRPYYYNRVSGELRDLANKAGAFVPLLATNKSRQLLYVHTSYTDAPDLYRMNWDGSAIARLTWGNQEFTELTKTKQYPVSFKLKNGQTRVGTLILPADVAYPPKNVKMVVWQEGGPGGVMLNSWQQIVERPFAILPNFGFGLLIVPLSGREGYDAGTLNALAANKNFGSIDIDEQAEIVQQAISKGWTKKGMVGITGCSYGGYFVWQSVIRHPDLYAAGNPQCALVDVVTEWTRGYSSLMPYLQGPTTPYASNAEFQADSPIYNTAKVKAAILTFHGTYDFLPLVQNENLHTKLVEQGKTARFLKFLGAGHGLPGVCCDVPEDAGIRFEVYAAQEMIQWFRTYLK